MWRIFQGWESIPSAKLEDATGYLLEFTDEPMLLQRLSEESSIDSAQQSTAQQPEDSIHVSRSEQK